MDFLPVILMALMGDNSCIGFAQDLSGHKTFLVTSPATVTIPGKRVLNTS
jgi:hypothetical protein